MKNNWRITTPGTVRKCLWAYEVFCTVRTVAVQKRLRVMGSETSTTRANEELYSSELLSWNHLCITVTWVTISFHELLPLMKRSVITLIYPLKTWSWYDDTLYPRGQRRFVHPWELVMHMCFFDVDGQLILELLNQAMIVNNTSYCDKLHKLRTEIKKLRHDTLSRGIILLYDNVRPSMANAGKTL